MRLDVLISQLRDHLFRFGNVDVNFKDGKATNSVIYAIDYEPTTNENVLTIILVDADFVGDSRGD